MVAKSAARRVVYVLPDPRASPENERREHSEGENLMAPKYRADQVGSFLRPEAVRNAHTAYGEGKISLEALRKIEDENILQLLDMQKQTGIDVYSDGEWRRGGWASGFADAMAEGYVPGTPAIRLQGNANPIAGRLGASGPGQGNEQGGG